MAMATVNITSSVTIELMQFRACSGSSQGFGTTPGDALNALITNLPNSEVSAPIVIFPFNRGDVFFTNAQQTRLQELKARRDTLTTEENEELESLVAASFDATIARTQAVQASKA